MRVVEFIFQLLDQRAVTSLGFNILRQLGLGSLSGLLRLSGRERGTLLLTASTG